MAQVHRAVFPLPEAIVKAQTSFVRGKFNQNVSYCRLCLSVYLFVYLSIYHCHCHCLSVFPSLLFLFIWFFRWPVTFSHYLSHSVSVRLCVCVCLAVYLNRFHSQCNTDMILCQKLDDDVSDAQLRGVAYSLSDDPATATLHFSRDVPRKLFFVNPGTLS